MFINQNLFFKCNRVYFYEKYSRSLMYWPPIRTRHILYTGWLSDFLYCSKALDLSTFTSLLFRFVFGKLVLWLSKMFKNRIRIWFIWPTDRVRDLQAFFDFSVAWFCFLFPPLSWLTRSWVTVTSYQRRLSLKKQRLHSGYRYNELENARSQFSISIILAHDYPIKTI